jgi:hypothetical protein
MKNRNEVGVVSDVEISWDCIKPILLNARGKSMKIKNEEFKKLNQGQKSIFSFHVYYDHAKNDVASFIYWSQLYLSNDFFAEIEKSASYFGDSDYSKILAEIEGALKNEGGKDTGMLYDRFKIAGESHKIKMGKIIKANMKYFYSYQE